jgi:hypothetical protein
MVSQENIILEFHTDKLKNPTIGRYVESKSTNRLLKAGGGGKLGKMSGADVNSSKGAGNVK